MLSRAPGLASALIFVCFDTAVDQLLGCFSIDIIPPNRDIISMVFRGQEMCLFL